MVRITFIYKKFIRLLMIVPDTKMLLFAIIQTLEDGLLVGKDHPPLISHRPFGRGTTLLRGLTITMVINYLLTGMTLQAGGVPFFLM